MNAMEKNKYLNKERRKFGIKKLYLGNPVGGASQQNLRCSFDGLRWMGEDPLCHKVAVCFSRPVSVFSTCFL